MISMTRVFGSRAIPSGPAQAQDKSGDQAGSEA